MANQQSGGHAAGHGSGHAAAHSNAHPANAYPANAHPGGHPAMDYAEHNRTYSGFIKGTVGVVVACVLILGGMAAFLV